MNMGQQGSGPYNPPKSGNSTIIIVVVAVAVLGFIFISAILAAILFPVFARARGKARETVCISHVMHLGSAMSAYRTDWGDAYPPSRNWNSLLATYAKDHQVFMCPSALGGTPRYAMNARMSGVRGATVQYPNATVTIYECEPGNNKAGGPELFPQKPRHMAGYTTGFADGHVMMIDQSSVGALNWDPAPKTAPTLPTGP